MDDNEILNVIAKALLPRGAGPTTIPTLPIAEAARAIVALRAAGYDVAPADTIRLGQAVEAIVATGRFNDERIVSKFDAWTLGGIYERASVERGGQ